MSAPSFLNALRAFEAAARHQSFSGAARELNVSSAAVGQLVRGLEEWLGVPLFTRIPSGRQRIVATEPALLALADIRAGFDRLSIGMTKLKESASQNTLKLTVSPAFAAKWLLPRIERFSVLNPETDLLLDTNQRIVDFVAQRIDIGVRYGAGHWPGLVAIKLMEEAVFPVCSPALFDELNIRKPADLLKQTLIHDLTGESNNGYVTWELWFKRVGVSRVSGGRGLQINNSAAVLQAAVEGQGIALARSVMACEDIKSGRLVKLLPELSVLSPLSYYAVYREDGIPRPRMDAFLAWLKEEAGKDCPTKKFQELKRF